jgi:hypothetical protein
MSFRRALLLAAVAASLAFASGCVHHVEPSPAPSAPTLEVGTGDDEFDPLGAGVKVPLNYGFQGGEHIWFAARVSGVGAQAVLTYGIVDEQGNVISNQQQAMLPDDADDQGWRTLTSLQAFVDAPVNEGAHVIFVGHVADAQGHELDATAPAMVFGSN